MTFRNQLLAILDLNFQHASIFTLNEVYQVAEGMLYYHFPNNSTIDSSIRSNLQKLEETGYIYFVDEQGIIIDRREGNGHYRLA